MIRTLSREFNLLFAAWLWPGAPQTYKRNRSGLRDANSLDSKAVSCVVRKGKQFSESLLQRSQFCATLFAGGFFNTRRALGNGFVPKLCKAFASFTREHKLNLLTISKSSLYASATLHCF